MDQSSFKEPAWYHATTLAERIASLRAVGWTTPQIEVNADLAERRLQRWRSQPPFITDSYFAQRLAMDGISEDEFRYLLGEPVEIVRDRFSASPAWLAEFAQAFSRPPTSKPIPLPQAFRDKEVQGFLGVVEPLIGQALDRLHEAVEILIKTYADPPFNPTTVENILFANLLPQLIEMLSRTMVLELNVARLQGLLKGDTPEARFSSFLERLRQRDITLAILREYPVLVRQVRICIDHWLAFSLEFLKHLCADWTAIRTMFSPGNDPGTLVHVNGGMGDSHRDGRSVQSLRFSSGFQLVYKPRSMAIDVHFQELLTWLNHRGDHPPFRVLNILDRETYGWIEFIAGCSCTSVDEIHRFYERQGAYLALLYALQATDFHFENLIAAGEHPILLDLESLFHPHFGGLDSKQATDLAYHTLIDSVLRTGMLPERIWANSESEGIDISGLGRKEGQITPYPGPHWEGMGTDAMQLTRTRKPLLGGENRPTLVDGDVNVLDYAEAIAEGFSAMYGLLAKHRDELLSDTGPLSRLADDEMRVMLRPTQTYGVLLREAFHPDILRNALDRDRLFDRLWESVRHFPHLAKVIAAEREDLQKGDVPRFITRPHSRDLWNSANERIPDFLGESGMSLVRRRLSQLNEDDLAKQLWFIRASLATLSMGETRAEWPTYALTEAHIIADRTRLLAAACAVGDRLATLALRGAHDVNWLGLTLIRERHWSLRPLGLDLYGGLPGLMLFLAYLGAIIRNKRYTALAQAGLATMHAQLEHNQSSLRLVGGFGGWGGVIYALAHLGMLWNRPVLFAEAKEIVNRLRSLIDRDEQFDIIDGAAGCIGGLISLYRCAPSDRTLAAAIQCGDRLIACAQSMEHGIGWVSKGAGTQPLSGFSHGTAGIAWALLELAALSGEQRFRKAALAAIVYERSLFSPEAENWPDLREVEIESQLGNARQSKFLTAWCHGAPGIGLARLLSLRHLDDSATRTEIDVALQTTLLQGFGHNHSLCHGDLGNLELLLQAGKVLPDSQWSGQVNRYAAMILESIDRHGWLCGVPLGVESPGLMTGLAGIGYELLRLAEPMCVPSVLMLEPPKPDRKGNVPSW